MSSITTPLATGTWTRTRTRRRWKARRMRTQPRCHRRAAGAQRGKTAARPVTACIGGPGGPGQRGGGGGARSHARTQTRDLGGVTGGATGVASSLGGPAARHGDASSSPPWASGGATRARAGRAWRPVRRLARLLARLLARPLQPRRRPGLAFGRLAASCLPSRAAPVVALVSTSSPPLSRRRPAGQSCHPMCDDGGAFFFSFSSFPSPSILSPPPNYPLAPRWVATRHRTGWLTCPARENPSRRLCPRRPPTSVPPFSPPLHPSLLSGLPSRGLASFCSSLPPPPLCALLPRVAPPPPRLSSPPRGFASLSAPSPLSGLASLLSSAVLSTLAWPLSVLALSRRFPAASSCVVAPSPHGARRASARPQQMRARPRVGPCRPRLRPEVQRR